MKTLTSLLLSVLCTASFSQMMSYDWAKKIGGSSGDICNAIVTDASGNVYACGYFQGTVDFDPGPGTTSLTSAGVWDIYFMKLDNLGNFQWVKQIGNTSADAPYDIAIDGSGNLYLAGMYQGTVDFDPGTGVSNLTAVGNWEGFVAKYDISGSYIWAKSIGGTKWDNATDLEVDGSGNVYTVGVFEDTVDFDPGNGVHNLASNGRDDLYLLKLSSAGNFQWARTWGSVYDDKIPGVDIDGSGNIYTCGAFTDTCDLDPGSGVDIHTGIFGANPHVMKFDPNGNRVWVKRPIVTGNAQLNDIAIDSMDNIVIAGTFNSNIDTDPGAGTNTLVSYGQNDNFVTKWDVNGNHIWSAHLGGTDLEGANAVATDVGKSVYLTGYFRGQSDFDPGSTVAGFTAQGLEDAYIVKLDSTGGLDWAYQLTGKTSASGLCIAVDPNSNVFSAGTFQDSIDFDPTAGVDLQTSTGSFSSSDGYIHKLHYVVGGINESVFNSFKAYPNPTEDGWVTLNIDGEVLEVQVTDVMGRTVPHASSGNQIKINGRPGMYQVTAVTRKAKLSSKVLVH